MLVIFRFVLDPSAVTPYTKVVYNPSTGGYTHVWYTAKINIISLSMGGVVARALLKDNADLLAGHIHHLVNIYAPHWGTPLANWAMGTDEAQIPWLWGIGKDLADIYRRRIGGAPDPRHG